MASSNRNLEAVRMKCLSCQEEYPPCNAGTCQECYEEASETEEDMKRQIEDLKSRIGFLSIGHHSCFTDLVIEASDDDLGHGAPSIPAHKAILVSRSPVFKAMLENEMEESRSGTIKIRDVSYETLESFIHFLYTTEISLDEEMACGLLVLAEKYQVKYLKTLCEKFLTSKLNCESAIGSYTFAHRYNANQLLEASLSLITDNMDKLTSGDDYKELVQTEPRLVVEIYEAYLAKQVNTASVT